MCIHKAAIAIVSALFLTHSANAQDITASDLHTVNTYLGLLEDSFNTGLAEPSDCILKLEVSRRGFVFVINTGTDKHCNNMEHVVQNAVWVRMKDINDIHDHVKYLTVEVVAGKYKVSVNGNRSGN